MLKEARAFRHMFFQPLSQCSEPSGGPTGDGGDNAKRKGRAAQDGTASRSLVQGKLLGEWLG